MDNQQLVSSIKEWLDIETKITEYSKELRELRKRKKF